jgi:FMN-dependent NADH-azoreductase
MKLLHIDSSILGEQSASRTLTAEIVNRYAAERLGVEITYRDLAAEELPHLSPRSLAKADSAAAARDAALLEEFLAAEVIVIGVPMYNFTIPSQLKAWIDRIAVAGKSFRYTEKGPQGLAGGKEVVLAISRGGIYPAGSPAEFGESYLKHLLGFLGIDDITVVRAEGLSHGPAQREAAMQAALAALAAIAPAAQIAA